MEVWTNLALSFWQRMQLLPRTVNKESPERMWTSSKDFLSVVSKAEWTEMLVSIHEPIACQEGPPVHHRGEHIEALCQKALDICQAG